MMITTAGADPSRELREHAIATIGTDQFAELAMGGGKQDEALRLVRWAAERGAWVCLKNLHLVAPWLPTLYKELATLRPDPGFRLWLTTELQEDIPAILVQSALKITFEAPPGLRRNLERSFASVPAPDPRPPSALLRGQMFALLSWFHAIVQERRTFVPQGWTKAYEFSAADMRAGLQTIDKLLARGNITDPTQIPWRTLHGLMENAIYGGRVDDNADVRILRAFVRLCFHPELLPKADKSLGRPLAPGVVVPANPSPPELEAMIASMPTSDSPKVFRLPLNVERSIQRATSEGIVSALASLSAASSSRRSFDRDAWRATLGPVVEMWEAAVMSMASMPGSTPPSSGSAEDDPLPAFVKLEANRGAVLVTRVSHDLEALKRVLFSSELLTGETRAIGEALLLSQVPESWRSEWDGPEDARAWMRAVARRRAALGHYVAKLEASRSAAVSMNVRLGDFFRPETLLNVLRQGAARKLGVAMDDLRLVNSFGGREALVAQGVRADLCSVFEGLLVQGAVFRDGCLEEADGNTPDLVELPACAVAWIASSVADPYAAATVVRVPVYATPSRERVVTDLDLPFGDARGGAARWVLAGVALTIGSD